MDDSINNIGHHFLGSGWAFPVRFFAGTLQVNVSANETNVNEAIDAILKTRKGERVMHPDFGLGLHQFSFRIMDEGLKGEIIEEISMALLHHEPRITVKEVDVFFTDSPNGLVEITIDYIYNQTNTRHNYVFPFHLNEGTNLD